MDDQMRMMREFHRVFEHHAPAGPTLGGYPFRLRAKLVAEEALEFVRACGLHPGETIAAIHKPDIPVSADRDADWIQMIDALCDVLYVTLGSFVSMGIDPVPFFAEVHRSNMLKAGGGKDADGKSLKPEGWEPPQIERLLHTYIAARRER